jgi:hypothetical protein
VVPEEIGGVGGSSSMTDTFLNCQQNMFLEKLLRRNYHLGILYSETPLDRYGMLLRSFSEKNTSFGYCFSETR